MVCEKTDVGSVIKNKTNFKPLFPFQDLYSFMLNIVLKPFLIIDNVIDFIKETSIWLFLAQA